MTRFLRASIAPLLLFCACASAVAAPVTLPRTEVRELQAQANGVDYRLYVSLPPSYGEGEHRYPVVYLLDADYAFAIARNVTEHLSDRGDLPETIQVAIAYAGPPRYRDHRTRDYTPWHVPKLPPRFGYQQPHQRLSGGAAKFREFLSGELIPLVDREYRTLAGQRVLVGHSYGGLFGAWLLQDSPELFSHYLLVSASLWYDGRRLLSTEARAPERPVRAYLAAGSDENAIMATDMHALQRLLDDRPGVDVHARVFEGENHNSVFPAAFTAGIRWLLGRPGRN